MPKKSEERLVCEDYVRKFPKMKILTLARKIAAEVGEQYPKLRDAEKLRRGYLLHIIGANGKRNRETATDKSLYKPLTHDTTNHKPEVINTGAKILLLDIETAPVEAYVWNMWKQNIQPVQIISDWFMLTWSAKWLFEEEVIGAALTPKEAKKKDDKRIVKQLWHLLNEADIVIAHNGIDFDIPKINTRFLLHGYFPPSPYQVIDTLRHVRKQFAISHNKLDYINHFLNLPRKVSHEGFEMWKGCCNGVKEDLDKMLEYNLGDIKILEETYLFIRPWIKPHPNLGLFILDETQTRCPSCGSTHLHEEGHYHTQVNVYAAIRCNNCGSVNRKRVTEITIKQRRHLVLSTPK